MKLVYAFPVATLAHEVTLLRLPRSRVLRERKLPLCSRRGLSRTPPGRNPTGSHKVAQACPARCANPRTAQHRLELIPASAAVAPMALPVMSWREQGFRSPICCNSGLIGPRPPPPPPTFAPLGPFRFRQQSGHEQFTAAASPWLFTV